MLSDISQTEKDIVIRFRSQGDRKEQYEGSQGRGGESEGKTDHERLRTLGTKLRVSEGRGGPG